MRYLLLIAVAAVAVGCTAAPTTTREPASPPAEGTPAASPTSGGTPVVSPGSTLHPTAVPTTDAPTPAATPAASPPGGTPGAFAPFGTVELVPAFLVDGAGEDIDTLAFWEAPDPADTLLFVTAKDNQLVEVWGYPFEGNELEPLRHQSFTPGSQVNGVVIDQQTDRLYVAVSRPRSTVTVFDLPTLDYVTDFIDGAISLGIEPNLGLLHHDQGTRVYVTDGFDIYILDAASGALLGDFRATTGIETIVGDSHHQLLYVPDEHGRTGIYVHEPDGAAVLRDGQDHFGSTDFDSDAEGILVYSCPADGGSDDGRGLIVVSDQRGDINDYEFYDRQSWRHLGVVRLDQVHTTDGIASTQRPLPDYPLGLFVAVDDDQRIAGVGWHEILAAAGLSC